MYHGWKYGPDGQCTEQPGEPEPFCHKIRIRSYPTREYLGLIFVYFGEGDPPELPRYPRFDRDGIKYVTRYRRRCNYFNNMDNDPIHVFFTHSRTIVSWRDGKVLPQITAEEDAHGVVHVARNSDGTINSSYHLFPNMAYREARTQARGGREPRGDNVNWKVPIDDHLHEVFNVEWFPHGELNESYLRRKKEREASHPHDDRAQIVDRIFSGELYWHDFPVDHGDSHFTNNVEDEVTQAGQGVIADRTTEHLGRTDVPVILFRKVWERELRAFAEGLPLKQWVPPGDYE
jgi:5,5'-dehydrodivanillate O-demethylase